MKNIVKSLAIGLAIVASPLAAFAAPGPEQVQISATVVKSCTFAPIPSINLGNYDWQAGITSTVSNELSVECNKGVAYWFYSDRGLNSQGSQNNMASNGSLLAYSLNVIDGNGPFDPAQNFNGQETETASGSVDNYALALNVPAKQTVPTGTYADTVTFNLSY
jgi:spore coat protein U-like protein